MAGPTITLTIAGDAKDAQKALRAVGSEAENMSGKVSGFGSTWQDVRGKIVGASAVIVGGMGLVGKELIGLAADAEQSLGAVDTVFKGSADQIKQWANSAANDLGLSAHQYREMSTIIGSQLKSLGVPMDQLAGQTNDLITLGADLAATFGGTTAEAVEALSAMFRGEFDPIERYGVSIKQADVNARLAAKGLDHLTGSARKNAEQQAILELLTEQTADAQGQSAREANTAAAQQQRLAAQVENLKTALGEHLLPIFTKVMAFINDTVIPWLQRNKDTVAQLGIAITGLAGFVLTANAAWKAYDAVMKVARGTTILFTATTKGLTVAQKALNMVMKMSPLGRIITLVTTLAGVVAAVGGKMGWLKDIWRTVTNAISSATRWVTEKVAGAWKWCVDKIKGFFRGVKSFVTGVWDGVVGAIKAVINGVISVINGAIDGINLIIKGINHIPGVEIGLIGKIPKLHTGGVVPGAPGQEVLTMLQAGEKVTRAGDTPKTVALTGGDEFGRLVVELLRKTVRQQGGDVQFVLGR